MILVHEICFLKSYSNENFLVQVGKSRMSIGDYRKVLIIFMMTTWIFYKIKGMCKFSLSANRNSGLDR